MEAIQLLLVDDNTGFRRILAQFLEKYHGEEVVVVGTAGRGEEALALVEVLRPRVILLDLMMPGLTGLETLLQLRRRLPDAGIIVLTLLDGEVYRQTALDAGADAFVCKTNLIADLLPTLRRVVQERGVGANRAADCQLQIADFL